jgi:hypothetical protein
MSALPASHLRIARNFGRPSVIQQGFKARQTEIAL